MFLNENEVREVIRKRLITYEITHPTKVQELILMEQSVTSGVSKAAWDKIKSELLPNTVPTELAKLVPWCTRIATILGAGTGAYYIVTAPFGGLWLKVGATALLGLGAYAIDQKIFPALTEWAQGLDVENYFLPTNANPSKNAFEEICRAIASKQIVMPKLPDDFATISGLAPDASKEEYDAAINASQSLDPANVNDFLSVPLDQFTLPAQTQGGGKLPQPPIYSAKSKQLCFQIAVEICQEMVIKNSGAQGVFSKLSSYRDRLTLYDLHLIDHMVGFVILNKRGQVGDFKWRDEAGGIFADEDFECSSADFKNQAFDVDTKSNIYYLCNVLDNGPLDKTGVDALVGSTLNVGDMASKQIFRFNSGTPLHNALEPYAHNDMARFNGHWEQGSDYTFFGQKFFDQLKPTWTEYFKQIFTDVGEWFTAMGQTIWDGIKGVWNWTTDKLAEFGAWLADNVGPVLTAAGAGILAFVAACWQFIVDMFTWIGEKLGVIEEEEGTTEGEDEVPAERTGSGGGGSRKYTDVESMQKVMNQYIKKYNLNASPTDEDGRWGGDTDRLWDIVTNHAFQSHPVFSTDPDKDKYDDGHHKWPSMSSALRDENGPSYVGYTNRPAGALAIVLDMYNGNVDFGNGKALPGSIGPGTILDDSQKSPSGEGETDVGASKGDVTQGSGNPKSTSTGTGSRGVRIRVETGKTGINTLEDVGFDAGTTRAVSLKIIEAIRKINFSGTDNERIIMRVTFNRNGKVRRVNYDRSILNPMNLFTGGVQKINEIMSFMPTMPSTIKRLLEAQGETIDLSEINYNRYFLMTITIPAGVKNI